MKAEWRFDGGMQFNLSIIPAQSSDRNWIVMTDTPFTPFRPAL
jgi:hypothetical protein